MLKTHSLPGIGLFFVLCLPALPVLAGDDKGPVENAMTIADHWSLPGILGGGVKTNDAYTDGNLFLTFPAYSTIGTNGWLGGDVIFIEPYSSWGEQGEVAVSLGLGWRHLFTGQSTSAVTHHDGHQAGFFEEGAFIGTNLFVDLLDTQFDNRFWQLGFGIEAGTRYLEMRANYYLPLSDRQVAEEIRTRQSFTTRSTTTEYDDPFATGYSVQQDVTLTTYATTTTIERLFRRYEDGMEGWDAEVAMLLPWIDRWMDVKLIGGYYAFDNQPFGPQTGGTGNVEGWKAGLEIRPVPAVVLNATWYEDERLTGSDWTAGLRLEIPFEAGDLGDGKGFWDRIGDAFRPRRRHLAERMIEPVKRQNTAVKIASSVEEDKSAAEVEVVTRLVSRSTNRIVLANTVVFVDNAIGSPLNPGTYEAPLDTITNGIGLGNTIFGNSAIVFVQGRPVSYPESVIINQGVRLFGSGSFPALGGKFFKGRTDLRPSVFGGFFARNVPSTVQVTGFNIAGGLVGTPVSASGNPSTGSGIFLENVANGIITRNSVSTPGLTFDIFAEANAGSSQLRISDNLVNGVIYVDVSKSANMVAEVSRNVITGKSFAAAITIHARENSVGNFTVTNNIATNSFIGMYLATLNDANAVFTVDSNYVARNGFGGGIVAVANNNSTASFFGTSNHVESNVSVGMGFGTGDPGSSLDVYLSGNTVTFNMGHQISAGGGGGFVRFLSDDVLTNDVRESAGNVGNLYNNPAGTPRGFIHINGFLHPASTSLP